MQTLSTQNRATRRAIRIDKVLEKTGLSKTHLYRLIQRGDFPTPTSLSERVRVWDESTIDAWLDVKFNTAANKTGAAV